MTRFLFQRRARLPRSSALAVGLALLPAVSDAGRPPPSLCTRAEVLQHVTEALRRTAPYARIVSEPVGERPGPRPDSVQCAIYVEQYRPDTVDGAARWLDQQDYTVRWLDPGFEVTVGGLRRPDPAPVWQWRGGTGAAR